MTFKLVPFWRYMLQLISLISFILLISILAYPVGSGNLLLQWFSRLDPWLLLSQIRWQQEVPDWGWLPLLTLAATLLWGRVFCGWLCPFGAFLSLADKLAEHFKKTCRCSGSKYYMPYSQ